MTTQQYAPESVGTRVRRRPRIELLGNGDLLVPVRYGRTWDIACVSVGSPDYVGWLDAYQAERGSPDVWLDLVIALVVFPLAIVLAIGRFAKGQVGPGIAVLLTAQLGAAIYAVVALVALGVIHV